MRQLFLVTGLYAYQWTQTQLDSGILIHNYGSPPSLIPSSSLLPVRMVKQNKAKVSKSKWVFPLNVIALGMGGDGY